MDERLARLAAFGANDNDARRTAALMIRQYRGADGELRALTPWDLEDSIDNMLVFLARYMHQDVSSLERRPMSQLHRWHAIVVDLLLAQKGQPPSEE